MMMNFESDFIEEFEEFVAILYRYEYRPKPNKLDSKMKNYEAPPARPFVEEAPKLGPKALPHI